MLILDANTKAVQLITGAALSTDWTVSYADHTSSTFAGADSQGNVATATTTTIVAAPSASTQRQIKSITIRNRDASSPQTVTLVKDSGGTDYHITPAVVLEAGESLIYLEEVGFTVYTATGLVKGAGSAAADGLNRISAGTQIAGTLATVVFSNSNGVTFGMSNSSVITASHNGLTSQSNQAASAANGSFAFQTLSFSNDNGFTFSTSAGSAIVGSYSTPGPIHQFNPYRHAVDALGAVGNGTLYIDPMSLGVVLHHDRVGFSLSHSNATSNSGSQTLGMSIGLYTKNASTLSLASSTSSSWGLTQSGTAGSYSLYAGARMWTVPWTNTLPASNYWAVVGSTSASAVANATLSQIVVSQSNVQHSGVAGTFLGDTAQRELGKGFFTAATSALPNSIAFSDILGLSTVMARAPMFCFHNGSI